ncbi:MAG: DNA polymerase III subunit delta [Pseudomonadota bacterium]
MATVNHHTLVKTLGSVDPNLGPDLFLICGDPYLVKDALSFLRTFLLGKEKNKFSIEKLDGTITPVGDIVEQVCTYSFLTPKKIVIIENIPLFQTETNKSCINYTAADIDFLTDFFEKGIPPGHVLVMTAFASDKRKKIYKIISEKGMVIDCSVAKGARQVDLDEQRSIMQHVAGQILSKYNKQLDTPSFQTLMDLTGFNLDLFSQNIEKLSAYVGDRQQITQQDVKAVVVREKKDPIFNLTNAIMGKEIKPALFYLNSLLKDGFHPLQILKSLENLFRKLILVTDCLTHLYPDGANLKQMSFNQFKHNVLPQIEALDKKTMKTIEDRELFLSGKALLKKDLAQDLFLAPSPQNAYPVYLTFQKSENFSLNELYQIMVFLSDLDYHLKTSSIDVVTQIENLMIKLCSQGGFVYAQKNQDRSDHF